MSILSAIEQVSGMLRARTWHAGATLRLDDAVAAETLEALERARVLGVLDAWQAVIAPGGLRKWTCTSDGVHSVTELMIGYAGEPEEFPAATPDAARAAAAKAIEAGEV